MNSTTAKQWSFSQQDTWFFREARPYDSIGGTQLSSVFPPSSRTVAGAIRTLLGEQADIDWQEFNKDKNHKLHEQIGDAESLGKLQLTGPYLLRNNQRLYPVPRLIMEGKIKGTSHKKLICLHPSSSVVTCDLGNVFLPEIGTSDNKKVEGIKPIEENTWLDAENLKYVLDGGVPNEILNRTHPKEARLFDIEPRLGIALNRETHAVEEHQLYQNQHIRIRYTEDLKIGVIVDGIDTKLHPETGQIRFGGEGRLAEIEVTEKLSAPLQLPDLTGVKDIFLTLVTPADLGKNWLLEGFEQVSYEGGDAWRGTIKDVELIIISAVLGKSIREGGWDLANEQPREVVSLVPAGSTWFCRVEKGNANDLQGFHIGKNTELGLGELVVGVF